MYTYHMSSEVSSTKSQRHSTLKFGQVLAGFEGIVIMIFCYLTLFLKPLRDTWGTNRDKHLETFPADEFIPHPTSKFSHAIRINAPVEDVWAWIAQIGQGRGGFYSYEILENLMGLEIYNVNAILDEFQNPQLGDYISFGAGTAYPIICLDPPYSMAIGVWHDRDSNQNYDPQTGNPHNFLQTTWLWHLESISPGQTVLYSRNRLKLPNTTKNSMLALFMEPIVFAMDRKMLLGIKRRAESNKH